MGSLKLMCAGCHSAVPRLTNGRCDDCKATTLRLGTKKPVETIDMTPTWRGIVPVLVAAIENGTVQGRRIALEELYRMADLADKQVEASKVAEGKANG